MKGLIIVVIVVVIGYGFVQWLEAFKARGDLLERVDHQLRFVEPTTMESVKQDIVTDAKKLGIDVATNDIRVTYEDTEQHTVAQQLVGKKIGVQYVNKRVSISVDYVHRILGIPLHESVAQAEIRQVEAPRKTVSPEMQQLLDATPQ